MKGVAKINLGDGRYALIDQEDNDLLSFNWSAHRDNKSGTYYACCRRTENGKRKRYWLHTEIMKGMLNRDLKPGEIVDHKNRDKLDCRRSNLRIATKSQNEANKMIIRGKSKYRGVSPYRGRWRAVIYKDKKQKLIGTFDSETDAARAYNEEARKLFCDYAVLNDV